MVAAFCERLGWSDMEVGRVSGHLAGVRLTSPGQPCAAAATRPWPFTRGPDASTYRMFHRKP